MLHTWGLFICRKSVENHDSFKTDSKERKDLPLNEAACFKLNSITSTTTTNSMYQPSPFVKTNKEDDMDSQNQAIPLTPPSRINLRQTQPTKLDDTIRLKYRSNITKKPSSGSKTLTGSLKNSVKVVEPNPSHYM